MLTSSGTIGHTAIGILVQGIPASIGLLLLIRYVLATPFLALLPLKYSQRWRSPQAVKFWRSSHLINLIISIAIGALTHIFWDGFTHPTGWFVNHLSILQTKILSLAVYKILQYSGGILGLLGLSIWLWIWIEQPAQQDRTDFNSLALNFRDRVIGWIIILSITTVFAGMVMIQPAHPEDSLNPIVVRAAIGVISGLSIGFVVYAIGFWSIFYKRS